MDGEKAENVEKSPGAEAEQKNPTENKASCPPRNHVGDGGAIATTSSINEQKVGATANAQSVATDETKPAEGADNGCTSDNEPGSSSPSSIKKMSNNFTKRHYRNKSGTAPDLDDSMDTDVFKAVHSESTNSSVPSCSTSSDDAHAAATTMGKKSEENNTQDLNPSNNDITNFEDIAEYGLQGELDVESVRENSESASRPVNPRFVNVPPAGDDDYEEDEHLSTSTDSSAENIYDMYLSGSDEEDGEEASSDSSDSALDDLDAERVDIRPRDKRRGCDDLDECETEVKRSKDEPIKKKCEELPKVLLKPKSKLIWSGPKELFSRELGYNKRKLSQSAEIFRSRYYGSLHSVERLELMKKLDGHNGCVNCINFNYSGTKLASGSDDLTVKVWNYNVGTLLSDFHSGHRSNVFQAKFLPLVGTDNWIATCGRDGQVMLTELDSTGSKVVTRKVAYHKASAHKLTVSPDTPHVFMSCGEDSVVYNIDIRVEKPQKLLNVMHRGKRVKLYSISGNPLCSHEFCVSGSDEFVRIYDTRKLSSSTTSTSGASNNVSGGGAQEINPLKMYCPHHLVDSKSLPTVTASMYSYDGREIVASYNDELIYLFDASHSTMADCIKVYEGHRNSATLKGVNFFGDRSQFIVSGSDCGHIFLWDKETESIANFLRGDENGVVNCLEPHPLAPIMATSGLDSDVKIWIPSNEKEPKMSDLLKTIKKNHKGRQAAVDSRPGGIDGHIMWAMWTSFRRSQRNRRLQAGEPLDSDEEDLSDMEGPDEDEDGDIADHNCTIS